MLRSYNPSTMFIARLFQHPGDVGFGCVEEAARKCVDPAGRQRRDMDDRWTIRYWVFQLQPC